MEGIVNAAMNISEFIEIANGLNVLGIKITKDNETVAEWHSEDECRRNIYSATKSFTSCAVGFAVQEGLISLNEKLTEAFSGDLPDSIDDNLKAATVRLQCAWDRNMAILWVRSVRCTKKMIG